MKDRQALLPRFSIARPVTVAMCLVALLVIGCVSYMKIRLQAFPSGWEWKRLWVWVDSRDTSPKENDQEICRLFETYLGTVKNLSNMRTWAGKDWADASLRFRPETDMSLAYNQVMDRLDRLKLELPPEKRDRTGVWKYNEETDQEIIWMGVAPPAGVEDIQSFIEERVQRRLERIDGVAKISFWGRFRKEIMVVVDQEQMRSLVVRPAEVVQALQGDNLALAGGYVHEGGKKYFIRSLARYKDMDEIRRIPIRRSNGLGPVTVSDVGGVLFGMPPRLGSWRINGKEAVGLDVYKESSANVVDVSVQVREELERIAGETGTQFNVMWDQGRAVRESIDNIQTTAIWGALFASLILLYFLRAVRMTVLITLSIPLCIMMTISALYFLDWSLNLLTMMGLMVGMGMVVDNAIVIVENIYRMRAKGMDVDEASVAGASEVGMAISMATLTTVVVFMPLMFMTGRVGLTFELTRVGIPVVVSLLGSLFVALIFIPLAAKLLGRRAATEDPKSVRWLRRKYHGGLRRVLAHRRDASLIFIILFVSVLYPASNIKKTTGRARVNNEFFIRFTAPPFFKRAEMERVATQIEDFLDSMRETYRIETVRLGFWRQRGFIRVYLKEEPNKDWWYQFYKSVRKKSGFPVKGWRTRAEVIEDVKKHIPQFVGVRVMVQTRWRSEPGVSVYLYGEDIDLLARLSETVRHRVEAIPDVVSVDSDLEFAEQEIQVLINKEQAHSYGITAQAVGRSISYQLRGVNLAPYYKEDREISVRLFMDEDDRQTLAQLKSFPFQSKTGTQVPLSAFATFNIKEGTGTIRREDGKMRMRVRAFTTQEDLKGLWEQIDRAMEGFAMPRGYSWNKGETYSRFQESDDTMAFAITMAITCVFLLMGVLFESFILPFAVLLSIPFAFLGVYWGLFLTGTVMGKMSQMGIILLIGVVVNNAIVLVDMINRLRVSGMTRSEAIEEAGYNRFRPILMTTFTTIFGLFPMAAGSATMLGTPYAPLGITMIGGLLSSTILTLFVVPLFYTYLDDLRVFLRGFSRNILRPRKTG
ncbi:MAG: efflux RND transporter permease subunit [Candidatus Latescibacteria bacterium]|nr:efflux RND transporter permease subunit [Candidatus Latescibacterota bacterium]